MKIDIFQPVSKKEQLMAQAMEAFSTFVLHEELEKCQKILMDDDTGSVGELQGGNCNYSIYRVSLVSSSFSFPRRRRAGGGRRSPHRSSQQCSTTNSKPAADLLLEAFHASPRGKRYMDIMTVSNLRLYMLGMCQRRSQERRTQERRHGQDEGQDHNYTLSNLMLILQFGGPTHGQVKHIDAMIPNIQICLYMSTDCPSTILYSMEGEVIENTQMLLDHWIQEEGRDVPYLVQYILEEMGNTPLASMWYTKYFGFWGSLNSILKCFGKLYQSVSFQYSWVADPGTVLLAGGNEVHAGPPTCGPRMFAFAVGVPEYSSSSDEEGRSDDGDGDGGDGSDDCGNSAGEYEKNGEIQYSPVLLHLDVCCVMFSIMDHDPDCILKQGQQSWNNDDDGGCGVDDNVNDLRRNGKLFLIELLIELVRDYPMRDYLLQIDVRRKGIHTWLEKLLDAIICKRTDITSTCNSNIHSIESDNNNTNDDDGSTGILAKLIEEAITSQDIFHCSLEDEKYRDGKKKRQRGGRRRIKDNM